MLSDGNHYYIARSGDDNNIGSKESPWRTLDKANRMLQPGDTVTLRDGVYEGIINPFSGGEKDRRIVYRSETHHGAILSGKEGSRYIINLNDRRYITIDDFKLLPRKGGFGYIVGSNFITLENCHMEHSSEIYCPLEFINSNHNRLLFNSMIRVIQRTSDSKIHGDGCHFINSSYNLIEGNNFAKIGHSPLRIWGKTPGNANFNVIKNNVFHNGWGRNFEFFNLDRVLFENNIITDAFNGARSADSGGKVFFTDGIFRNNLIYDNWDYPLASNSYIDLPTTGDVPLELNNSRIYNNTFVNNPTFLWGFSGPKNGTPIRSNKFINNIFANNDYFGDFVFFTLESSGVTNDNQFHNNLLYGNAFEQALIYINGQNYTAKKMNDELSSQSSGNIDVNPGFVSMEDRNFSLSNNSEAINRGSFLTKALNSDKGRKIQVGDARYFYDGFGIEGEEGDIIVIGQSKLMARVVHTDLEKNELTLDRDLSWEAGDQVNLPFSGKAPDLGAFQYGSTGTLNIIPVCHPYFSTPGQPVVFSTINNDVKGDLEMIWDFGDGNTATEESLSHVYKSPGDYVVRFFCKDKAGNTVRRNLMVYVEQKKDSESPLLFTSFEEDDFEEWGHLWDRGTSKELNTFYPEKRDDGQGQCMSVSSEGENSRLTTNIKMRIWDIDKYPFISFSYKIPKGVPVGVLVETWSSKKHPIRIYLGGSESNSSGKNPNLLSTTLIDDNQWHVAKFDVREVRKIIPEIKYLKVFGFSTEAKVVEGQKFWFDDFSITSSK